MSRKSIKFICLALSTVLITSAFAGCGAKTATDNSAKSGNQTSQTQAPSDSGKKVTLTFWNGFTGPDGDLLKDIVKKFNDSHSGKIEVKMDIMGWDVLSQKLPPAIATGTAPSMDLLIQDWLPQYAANGSIQTMDDFWSKSGLKESDYVQNVLDLLKLNGKYYAMPMQFNLIYLFWNKDLFKAAGLDPEKVPQTMDEFASDAVKLTDPSKNQYGLGLPVKGSPQYYTSLVWNNGGELFDLKSKKSLLNTPENIKTFEWLQDLAINKKVTPKEASGADLENLFQSGKLGMYVDGPWLIGGLKKNNINFGISVVPKGLARQQVISGGIGFTIPSSTKPEEKSAVYEFIKYWMSPATLKEWDIKNGSPAIANAVINDPEVKADPILGSISPLNTLGRVYNGEGFQNIASFDNDALWPMMESILTGASKPSDAVKKASDKIDEIFKTSK